MRITPGWQGKTKGRGRTRLDSMKLIKPHGGKLVNREVTGRERDRLIQAAINMPALRLNAPSQRSCLADSDYPLNHERAGPHVSPVRGCGALSGRSFAWHTASC